MKLPWVTRALLEAVQHERDGLAAQFEGCQDLIQRREERYDALVHEMLAMKRDGFSAPLAPQIPSQPTVEPPPKLPPAILLNAVKTVSPVRDKIYEFNLQTVYDNEHLWDDEDQCRMLAERIVNGSSPFR
jgi:hypothetical protein